MRSDTVSILGLYNYDRTIFDLLTLPEGLDNETLIKSICSELAELELLYPNAEVMKDLIGVWSAGSQYEWDKLYQTMLIEYNPIDNYDRTETRTLTSQGTGTGADGGSDSLSTSKSHQATEQDTGKVTAFNSGTLADKNQTSGTSSATDTETASTTYGKTKQETFSKTDSETIRARGNIGVTTTMQMLKEQRDIVKFNLYDIITEEFKMRFCILVY